MLIKQQFKSNFFLPQNKLRIKISTNCAYVDQMLDFCQGDGRITVLEKFRLKYSSFDEKKNYKRLFPDNETVKKIFLLFKNLPYKNVESRNVQTLKYRNFC